MGSRILIADDDADLRELLALQLHRQHYEVEQAHDGVAMVELALTFRPAVLLVDFSMPRMNGVEALRLLRGSPRTAGAWMIVHTGQPVIAGQLPDPPWDALLAKPADPARVLEAVQRGLALLASRATVPEGPRARSQRIVEQVRESDRPDPRRE